MSSNAARRKKTNLLSISEMYHPRLLFALFDSIEPLFCNSIKQVGYSRLNLDGSSIVPNESLRQIKLISGWAKKVIRATRPHHTNPHTAHESGFLAIKDRQT